MEHFGSSFASRPCTQKQAALATTASVPMAAGLTSISAYTSPMPAAVTPSHQIQQLQWPGRVAQTDACTPAHERLGYFCARLTWRMNSSFDTYCIHKFDASNMLRVMTSGCGSAAVSNIEAAIGHRITEPSRQRGYHCGRRGSMLWVIMKIEQSGYCILYEGLAVFVFFIL
eukprot:SAG11_NODE_1467_length_4850_cov_7.452957_7_plen_171_part_00